MGIGKFKLLVSIAGVALACAANGQYITGSIGVNELAPQNGAFTTSSLKLNPTNVVMSTSGIFAGTVPSLSDLYAYSSTITGLSSTALSDPINNFFVFSGGDIAFGSSGTTPPDRFVFDLATITEVAYNSANNANFSGTGTLVDTSGAYLNTAATFNLSFSGPNNYSFTLTAVPEPTTISLIALGLGAWAFRRRKS